MKYFIYYLLILFYFEANAQEKSMVLSYKPSLSFLGCQNANYQNRFFKSSTGNISFKNAANITFNYKFTTKIIITGGLEYAQQGQNITLHVDKNYSYLSDKTLKIKLNYLRLPITIGYSIPVKTNLFFDVNTGLSFGISTLRTDNLKSVIFEKILLPNPNNFYTENDLAVPFSINLKKKFSTSTFMNLGFESLTSLTSAFDQSFNNLNNTDYSFGVISEMKNYKQQRISMNIGIGFKFN